jgi:hypothetical protein
MQNAAAAEQPRKGSTTCIRVIVYRLYDRHQRIGEMVVGQVSTVRRSASGSR